MARKELENDKVESDMEADENHAELRVYELGFHIDGELPQDEAKKSYTAIKDVMTGKGTLVAEGEMEKIQLAYTISRMDPSGRRDFSSSYFAWIAYEADGEVHAAVVAAAGADKNIFRFLDLRTTKEAAQHAAEMHEFYLKAPEAPIEEEPADAELDAALKEAGVA